MKFTKKNTKKKYKKKIIKYKKKKKIREIVVYGIAWDYVGPFYVSNLGPVQYTRHVPLSSSFVMDSWSNPEDTISLTCFDYVIRTELDLTSPRGHGTLVSLKL